MAADLVAWFQLLCYPNGYTFEPTYASSNPGYVREAEVVQAQLTAVGIKVAMLPAPDTPSILRLFSEGATGSGFSAIAQGFFDPAEQLLDKHGPTSYLATTTGNSNAEITALGSAARSRDI